MWGGWRWDRFYPRCGTNCCELNVLLGGGRGWDGMGVVRIYVGWVKGLDFTHGFGFEREIGAGFSKRDDKDVEHLVPGQGDALLGQGRQGSDEVETLV